MLLGSREQGRDGSVDTADRASGCFRYCLAGAAGAVDTGGRGQLRLLIVTAGPSEAADRGS